MAANSAIKVTNISFDDIKSNLKSYLSAQSELSDYDFESSALSTIVDILAYNTYHTAIYTNMVANEMYLDSAIIRNNVVSRAKQLGYTPRSARGARAEIRINIDPGSTPSSITIPANTSFTTSINNQQYTFITPQATVVTAANGTFSSVVSIREGTPLTHRWIINTSTNQRFILPNQNVDTTSIKVKVQESTANTSTTSWLRATDLSKVQANSQVYFLQETTNSQYELIFGDGVFGKRLVNGNVLVVDYQVCNGPITNGVRNFTASGPIGGFANYTITPVTPAYGGAYQEQINSIKYTAPRSFEAQNRIVTKSDFKAAILAEYGDLQSVVVWGGEESDPPQFSKVFIAAKPKTTTYLSRTQKQEIIDMLLPRTVMGIEPVFVDPTFVYIVPFISAKYKSNITSKTPGAIVDLISNAVTEFESNNLGIFNNNFFFSKFLTKVAEADKSIEGINCELQLMKKFTPVTTSENYTFNFNNSIYNPHSGHIYAVRSNAFRYNNQVCYFDDDGAGALRIYRLFRNQRVYENTQAGSVDYENGTVETESLVLQQINNEEIRIFVDPETDDVASVKGQILLIDETNITLTDTTTGKLVASFSAVPTTGSTQTLFENPIGTLVF